MTCGSLRRAGESWVFMPSKVIDPRTKKEERVSLLAASCPGGKRLGSMWCVDSSRVER
jgi:hypothetical protein